MKNKEIKLHVHALKSDNYHQWFKFTLVVFGLFQNWFKMSLWLFDSFKFRLSL